MGTIFDAIERMFPGEGDAIFAQLAKIPPDFKLYRPGEYASPEEIEANRAKLRGDSVDPHP